MHAPRFGTVGKALPNSEVMLSTEGEILMRGPHVFAGYRGDPDATARALIDGWLYSGDIGSLSEDGYLTITGRKKDLIITSSGKNVAPANIENALRETRWISEAVVYGDRRPYLVCMLTLDPDEAPKLAAQLGVSPELSAMAQDERVREVLQKDVDAANALRPDRAGQALRDPRPGADPGRRRAHPHAQGQASRHLRALRRALRPHVRGRPEERSELAALGRLKPAR
jgi:long-chain acyl-CoA synthetase